MLPPEISEKCHKLDVRDKEFEKWHTPATYMGISIVVFGILTLIFTPQGKNVHYQWYSYAGAIYFLIGVPIAYFLSKKASKYKIIGFEKNAVETYRAYGLLEKYQKDNLYSQLENAQSHMESILSDLRTWDGDSSQDKPPFMSLASPIDDFIKNLDNRLIPSIIHEESEKITMMQNMLSQITMLFMGEEFDRIKSVNKEIEDNYEDVSKEKKSTSETLKQHRHIVTFLISFGIVVVGGILAYSTRFISESISVDTQILAWVGISVPFVIWCIRARQSR